jgi:hypothetical protein
MSMLVVGVVFDFCLGSRVESSQSRINSRDPSILCCNGGQQTLRLRDLHTIVIVISIHSIYGQLIFDECMMNEWVHSFIFLSSKLEGIFHHLIISCVNIDAL